MSKAIGMFVMYKENPYIIVKDDGEQVHLNSPDLPRVKVNKSSVRRLECRKAKQVGHNGNCYLVTKTKLIFSLATGKLMNWGDNNGDRKIILQQAGL